MNEMKSPKSPNRMSPGHEILGPNEVSGQIDFFFHFCYIFRDIARQIKSLFRQNRSLCGTSIQVGHGALKVKLGFHLIMFCPYCIEISISISLIEGCC